MVISDPVGVVQRLCAKRMSFVRGLSTFKVFGKGWSKRIADIEARAVKMALSVTSPGSVKPTILAEANKAAGKASSSANKAVGSGATAVVSNAVPDQWVALGLLAVALAAGVYFIWRAAHNKERARAYAQVASEG